MNSIKNLGYKSYRFFIEDRSFIFYFCIFVFLILGFGIAYSAMREGHNVVPEEASSFWPRLLHGQYFSVVTITSLGFGDLRPQGLSRLLAGVEVVLGLTLIGLMITKLTSYPITHYVSSVFVSDAQRQLATSSSKFNLAGEGLTNWLYVFAKQFQQTPKAENQKAKVEHTRVDESIDEFDSAKQEFSQSVDKLMNCSKEFHDYFVRATDSGRFLKDFPVSSLDKLIKAQKLALNALNQCLVASLSPDSDNSSTSVVGIPSAYLSRVITLNMGVCTLVSDNVQDKEIRRECSGVEELCTKISIVLGREPGDEEPDQAFEGDDPIG